LLKRGGHQQRVPGDGVAGQLPVDEGAPADATPSAIASPPAGYLVGSATEHGAPTQDE
jgi:hypothetical protein